MPKLAWSPFITLAALTVASGASWGGLLPSEAQESIHLSHAGHDHPESADPAAADALAAGRLEYLADGLTAKLLIKAGDPLSDGTTYQEANDFTGYFPLDGKRGYLLVGHELRYKSHEGGLGGRFTRLKVENGSVTRSETWVGGMHFNCAGTVTPWKTVLSGEENPHEYLPRDKETGKPRMTLMDRVKPGDPAAEVGWVYEIDPFATSADRRKARRPALGRFSHESVAIAADALYLTEDAYGGHFFKYVPTHGQSLSDGKLFAYQAAQKAWLPVKDIYNARPEATEAGATPYNRLEDLQIGPDGKIYLAETGDYHKGDKYGRILRFDPATKAMETWLEGDGITMAQPDNLIIDKEGRLLICEDQYDQNLADFGANQLLRVSKDKAITPLLATRRDGEPSGPSWGPGGVLFLTVMAKEHSGLVAISGL
jgi:secreted PhoX family phosphatase